MGNNFKITWAPEALRQVKWMQKNRPREFQKDYFSKVEELIDAISKSPFRGIGHPEHMRHEVPPCWSRRINKKDRLVYRIKENFIEVISIIGHYE